MRVRRLDVERSTWAVKDGVLIAADCAQWLWSTVLLCALFRCCGCCYGCDVFVQVQAAMKRGPAGQADIRRLMGEKKVLTERKAALQKLG